MAKEYIEREALIEFYERVAKDEYNKKTSPSSWADAYECVIADIDDRPAADVVEVRHGEWVKDTKTADVCAEYRCSLCGFMYCESDPKYPPYKYCPECGSKNE